MLIKYLRLAIPFQANAHSHTHRSFFPGTIQLNNRFKSPRLYSEGFADTWLVQCKFKIVLLTPRAHAYRAVSLAQNLYLEENVWLSFVFVADGNRWLARKANWLLYLWLRPEWDNSAMPFRRRMFWRWAFRRQIGYKTWYFWWERFLCTYWKHFVFNFMVQV